MGEKQKFESNNLDCLSAKSLGQKRDTFFFSRKRNDYGPRSVFFSRRGVSSRFFTEDSGLYVLPSDFPRFRKEGRISRTVDLFDAAFSRDGSRNRINPISWSDIISLKARRNYLRLRKNLIELLEGATGGMSVSKMWNLSIVGAVIFGMFTMTMVYRYLGQNVSAKMEDAVKNSEIAKQEESVAKDEGNINDDIDIEYITRIIENEDSGDRIKKKDFEKEIMSMVSGYPIEKMVPEIIKQDRVVAAFLIAIAKKESNWGKRVPVLDGQDCFNYWGYRGIRDRMGTGGHTCFDSPKDAVETVGKRIEYLVSETKRNTPDKMVVWKCGYDCSWDNKTAVRKWISDVDLYFKKLNKE